MPHILSMSVNPDTALRDRSCALCNSSALAISCCGLCAFWVRIDALLLICVMIAYPPSSILQIYFHALHHTISLPGCAV